MTLRDVSAPTYSRLERETELEFQHFALWLHAPHPRPAPFDYGVANRNEWATRAATFDGIQADAHKPRETWAEACERFKRVVTREIGKLDRASKSTEAQVLIPHDLRQAYLAVRNVPDVPRDDLDVSSLTLEELKAIEISDAVHARRKAK